MPDAGKADMSGSEHYTQRPPHVGMQDPRRRPILVTGAPRAGTTWVGRMLDLSPRVGYINEPFNPTHQPGICSCVFPHWYQYIHAGNEDEYIPGLTAMLRFRYLFTAQLQQRPSRATMETLVRDGWNFTIARVRGARPLLKDPIAAFSSDWLARTFGATVVVVVRHPAAFAASVKRLGWTFPFRDVLAQEILMKDHLGGFEGELRRRARESHDPVDHSALMWRLVYTVLFRFGEAHPDWLFVRQEDLARGPVEAFDDLYRRLELRYTDPIARKIRWYSSGEIEREGDAAEHDIRRHSLDTIGRWRDRLSREEQMRVRSECETLAERFYSSDEW
jgi:hypothetical protein